MICRLALRSIFVGLTVLATAAPVKAETCPGTQIEGPWYSFVLPNGMRVLDAAGDRVQSDSVWVEGGTGPDRVMFFLYAPQHGGKPYGAYLGAEQVTRFVEVPYDGGIRQVFTVDYEDGSTGFFEGDSQRVHGLRVYEAPLDAEGHQRYDCFTRSIESYAE